MSDYWRAINTATICKGYSHAPWCEDYVEGDAGHVHDFRQVEGQSSLECACGAVPDYESTATLPLQTSDLATCVRDPKPHRFNRYCINAVRAEIEPQAENDPHLKSKLDHVLKEIERSQQFTQQLTTKLERQAETMARLVGERDKARSEAGRLREALQQIAAFDDAGANLILRKQGDYSGFDEPGAVQTARTALDSRERG